MSEHLLNTRQVAELLGISKRTVERMRHDGGGPTFVRASAGTRRGRVGYRPSQVDEWVKGRELRSTSEKREAA